MADLHFPFETLKLVDTIVESSPQTLFVYVLAMIVVLATLEQVLFTYRRIKYGLEGPTFVVPFIGGIVSMIQSPYAYWERQRQYAPSGASANTIFGWFTIFVTRPDAARSILMNNGPDSFLMVLHPSGSRILGENNIAFQHGPRHLALRHSFLPLFGRKALGVYLSTQMAIIQKHLSAWLAGALKGPAEVRDLVRALNQETSQSVFVGPYLDDPASFTQWYTDLTNGFLSAPIYFPGTTLWKAVEARKKVVAALTVVCQRAKLNMAQGGTPVCLVDFWAQRINEIIAECKQEDKPAPAFTGDVEMGETVMDFLFASQDASTASLAWAVHFMSERPDVLALIRKEQARVRPNNEPITFELLEQMVYARCVVKEILRLRTPPPMVPNQAQRDFELAPGMVVPKGAIVIPSTWNVCLQGFPEPHLFDPSRMDPAGRAEDVKFKNNFLPFGCGPHYCVGREYAMNHLTAFVALMATTLDWTRERDGQSENDILYLPTLYPAKCLITPRPRDSDSVVASD